MGKLVYRAYSVELHDSSKKRHCFATLLAKAMPEAIQDPSLPRTPSHLRQRQLVHPHFSERAKRIPNDCCANSIVQSKCVKETVGSLPSEALQRHGT